MTLVDKTRIAALLTDALAQPREPSEILQRVLRHVDSPQIAVEMTVGERLAPAIAREAPFSEGRFFISVGGGGFMPFGGQEAARFLVRRVNHGRGCDEAVDDLNELLNTSSTDYIAVLALWGVTVDAEITLAENLTLAPFNSLPDSVMKARLMTVDYLDILRPMVFSSQPTCALVYRFSQSPVLLKHGIEQPRLPEPMPAERLMAAALPLSLVGPSAPLQGPHCTQPLELVVGVFTRDSGFRLVNAASWRWRTWSEVAVAPTASRASRRPSRLVDV